MVSSGERWTLWASGGRFGVEPRTPGHGEVKLNGDRRIASTIIVLVMKGRDSGGRISSAYLPFPARSPVISFGLKTGRPGGCQGGGRVDQLAKLKTITSQLVHSPVVPLVVGVRCR